MLTNVDGGRFFTGSMHDFCICNHHHYPSPEFKNNSSCMNNFVHVLYTPILQLAE